MKIRETREVKELIYEDGVKVIWHYDDDISKVGPFKVEINYPKDKTSENKHKPSIKEKLLITKQMFYNPHNGKMVGYTRAKMLKLI
jgi:hypothetical protein